MKIEHVGIYVKDLEEMRKFYNEILGFQIVREDSFSSIAPWQSEVIVCFLKDDNNGQIELIYEPDQDKEYEIGDKIEHICLIVDDLDAKVKQLKDEKVEFVLEPQETKYGTPTKKLAFIKDPEGIWIELKELKEGGINPKS